MSVGAADLMSDLFILTDTEPELTVPTHKYQTKLKHSVFLFLVFPPTQLRSATTQFLSQGKTVRLHPPPKFTYYSPLSEENAVSHGTYEV